MIPNTTTRLLDGLDQSDQSENGDDSPSLMELSLTSSHEDMTSFKDSSWTNNSEPARYEPEQDLKGYHQAITTAKPPVRDVCIHSMTEKRGPVEQMEPRDIHDIASTIKQPVKKESCTNITGSSEDPEEVRLLMEIKATYESEMAKYMEQITTWKETVVRMRAENSLLRDQLSDFKANNHLRLIQDLQEQVKKWETLYFETAEIGAARLSCLEGELEQLRSSAKSKQDSGEHGGQEQTNNLRKALRATVKSSKAAQKELEEFKQSSNERESLLKEMLENAHSEKERELEILKSNQESEQEALLEKIEDLESDLKAKSAIIERERNQASKREARLKEQIRKLQPSSPIEFTATTSKTTRGAFDSALTTFSKVLDGSLCLCSAEL